MAYQSWDAENSPKKMRGFLDFEDDEVKFFTRRFFILKEKEKVLEYYKEDPLVYIFILIELLLKLFLILKIVTCFTFLCILTTQFPYHYHANN